MPGRRRTDPAERRAHRAAVDDPGIVMEAATAFLAVRSRSVDETRRRLLHLGYRTELVDGVIDELLTMGYLDDATFARAWVESRDRSRPRGENALRRELFLKGIERDTIATVLADRAATRPRTAGEGNAPHGNGEATGLVTVDGAAAERLLERRRAALSREPDPRKRRHKAYALLARNGFDPEIARQASAAFGSPDDPHQN